MLSHRVKNDEPFQKEIIDNINKNRNNEIEYTQYKKVLKNMEVTSPSPFNL